MKKLLTSVALISALGAGAAMVPAHAQWLGYGNGYWNDYEAGLWESDNFATDNYGVYDQDFAWGADENAFGGWYGDSESYWNSYDDIGDGGWFDV